MSAAQQKKPLDKLEALITAIENLKDAVSILSCGEVEVGELKLKGRPSGRYELERSIKAEPSIVHMVSFMQQPIPTPLEVVGEVSGVRITLIEV